ncbi:MAG TPA: ferritin-like domain-containing protein [Gemmatimonadaceae bacterium]|nr:ferritin-like domain-containing protein [Gemmatimonadaceae bacterium]
MALDSLQDLYVEQLRDLYSAEQQILDALPKMIDASTHPQLKQGFELHQRQTEEQVRRLEQIFRDLGERPGGEKCDGMEGLLKEGKKMMKERGDDNVRDAGIIASAQRVEHYEIAGYGSARNFALGLGRERDAQLLQQTLDEEGETDHKLTQIAESVVNPDAGARRADREVARGTSREAGMAGERASGTRRDIDTGRSDLGTTR